MDDLLPTNTSKVYAANGGNSLYSGVTDIMYCLHFPLNALPNLTKGPPKYHLDERRHWH